MTPKRSRQQIINYFCRRWRLIFQRIFVCCWLFIALTRLLALFFLYSFVLFYRHLLYAYCTFFYLSLSLSRSVGRSLTRSLSFGRFFWAYVYGKINDMIKPFLLYTHNARLYVIRYSFHFMYVFSIRLNDVGYCCALNLFLNGTAYYSIFICSILLTLYLFSHQRVNWMFVSQWKKPIQRTIYSYLCVICICHYFCYVFFSFQIYVCVCVCTFYDALRHTTSFSVHCSFSMMQWLIARSLIEINSLHVLFRFTVSSTLL